MPPFLPSALEGPPDKRRGLEVAHDFFLELKLEALEVGCHIHYCPLGSLRPITGHRLRLLDLSAHGARIKFLVKVCSKA